MEILKKLFGEGALTFAQFSEALSAHPEIKLADLAGGEYVAKGKYDAKENELLTANNTIKTLQDAVRKFDGVDVEGLKNDAKNWENKYNQDIAALKLSAALDTELLLAKAKNLKVVKGCIDTSKIKLDGDKLLGLSEQLDALRTSDAYLFEEAEKGNGGTPPPAGTGMAAGKSGGEDLSGLSDEEYYSRIYNKTT